MKQLKNFFEYFKNTHGLLVVNVKTSNGTIKTFDLSCQNLLRGLSCCLKQSVVYEDENKKYKVDPDPVLLAEENCQFKTKGDTLIVDDLSREDAERIFHATIRLSHHLPRTYQRK